MIIAAILIYIYGICDGIIDKQRFHYRSSIFKIGSPFWDMKFSWKNKYKKHDPKKGEKFPGSTTIFAWTTDGFHLTKTIKDSAIQLLIACLITTGWKIIVAFFVIKLIKGFGFHLTYSILLKKES